MFYILILHSLKNQNNINFTKKQKLYYDITLEIKIEAMWYDSNYKHVKHITLYINSVVLSNNIQLLFLLMLHYGYL